MANFGGPDANMSAQLISVLQRKQDRRIEGIQSIGKAATDIVGMYQTQQQLDLKKEDQAIAKDKLAWDISEAQDKLAWDKNPANPDNKYREQVAAKYAREATPEHVRLGMLETLRRIELLEIEARQRVTSGMASDMFKVGETVGSAGKLTVKIGRLLAGTFLPGYAQTTE